MDTSASTSQIQDSRSETPLLDEMTKDMVKDVPMSSLTLERDFKSQLVDDSIHNKRGIIIQFINSGCPGTFPVIGGVRINLEDIRMIPQYLHQNQALIKQHGARILLEHWKAINFGLGSLENLTIEDFGLVFTVASVSNNAIRLNPNQRTEGPLFYCHLPAMVFPQTIINADWATSTEEYAVHIINAYITLIAPHQRRSVMIKRDREEKANQAAVAAAAAITIPQGRPIILPTTGYTGAISKKSKSGPAPSTPGAQSRPAPYPARAPPRPSDTTVLREEMNHLNGLISRIQSQIIPSPPLPTPRTPIWPRENQGPDLPDGL